MSATTNTFVRRFAVCAAIAATTIGAGVALSGVANADTPKGGAAASDCTYGNVAYSEGSIITNGDGHKYMCTGGKWIYYSANIIPKAPIGVKAPVALSGIKATP
jgi:hypothetical protein